MRRICLLVVLVIAMFTMLNATDKEQYVCPMECKNAVFGEPGTCPVCGMNLIKRAEFEQRSRGNNAAILLFNGVQIIDYTGPYEILGQADFRVYTVAEKKEPITTSMNMTVTPSFDFENAPQADVLLIPGGTIDSALNSPATIRWIQNQAAKSQHVLSVCNGAFLLAKAGLLDGLTATTFHRLIKDLKTAAPKTTVVSDRRFVDNGKIITSAGLTSGMDATMYLVSKIRGFGEAQQLALHLEYDWKPKSNWARAALPDMNLPDLDLPQGAQWKYISTSGTMDEWEVKGSVRTGLTKKDLMERIQKAATGSNWKEVDANHFQFKDEKGRNWNATIEVEPTSESNQYTVTAQLRAQ